MTDTKARTPSGDDAAARREARSRRRPPRRRAGVPILVVVVLAVLALVAGVAVGYVARGEPEPATQLTLERPVPVVTVTVEAP